MKDCSSDTDAKGIGFFERYLTVWVILCIVAGIALGKIAPGVAKSLDAMAIYVGDAPVVSVPMALCLFFMMYPIMVKIDFAEVLRAGKAIKPVGLTLLINWAIKPLTMYAIATATMLFGLSSGAALATVVGVLIEVPLMLMLVKFCLKTQDWFEVTGHGSTENKPLMNADQR
jgi:ACR3 family arsenite efflux pump ArsB